MTGPADRLAALGLMLPPVTAPVAAYVPALRTGAYVYVSGQVPVAFAKPVAPARSTSARVPPITAPCSTAEPATSAQLLSRSRGFGTWSLRLTPAQVLRTTASASSAASIPSTRPKGL